MRGRHVVITGGTGGLGSAVTRTFLEAGAHVTVPFFAAKEADRLRGGLDDAARTSLTLVETDLRDEDSVRGVMEAPERLDALVHLVGGFAMGPTHEMDLDAFRNQLELNVTMAFLACKHALRRMREAGHGRIVTVGSRAALEPAAGMAAYCASKAALVMLTRSIAEETRDIDVTANAVLPSTIDTPANRAAMGEENAHRWVEPESLAGTILYLASEAAGDLRGTAMRVYGGA